MGKTRRRILCVENDEDTCDMLTLMLGKSGYDIVQAESVGEGLGLIRR